MNILVRTSVTFSSESRKLPDEDGGLDLEDPDRNKAIKFEKVLYIYIAFINSIPTNMLMLQL